jgi:hypothetical protein
VHRLLASGELALAFGLLRAGRTRAPPPDTKISRARLSGDGGVGIADRGEIGA